MSIKDEISGSSSSSTNVKNKPVIPHNSLSSPPPGVKYKYEKKDIQKSEKKELSISYKYYSKFFKPDFTMEDIKIGETIDCPFNNCTISSISLAKLITHIMTNHQDKLTVISDYYCSICGKRLPDITIQLIHCVEHQYNKRRKIFSKDHSTSISSTASLLNPLNSLQNSFIPINTTLPIPPSKSLNTKSSKLKRKYPFSVQDKNKSLFDGEKNKDKENNIFPLTPSPTSSISQSLTTPTKFSEEQVKENNTSLNININSKEGERVKKLKSSEKDFNVLLEKSLDKLNKNIPEKVQLQLGQSSDNILQLKNITNKTLNNNKSTDEGKSILKNIPSPISSPIVQRINHQHTKENSIMSSPPPSKSEGSSNVSYTRSKLRIPCVVESCKKTYKNIKGLKTHISRYHPEVHVNIEELVESYKIHSEQEEIKKSKKLQNIIPISTPPSNNSSNASTSDTLSIDNNVSLLKIPSDTMNVDKSLTSDSVSSLIKGKTPPNKNEDSKKEKISSTISNNSMNIDTSVELENNLDSKAVSSLSTNDLNLLQNCLINNNNSNSELESLHSLNLNSNPYSFLGNDMNMPLNLQNSILFNNILSDSARNNAELIKNTSLLSDLAKTDLTATALSSQFPHNNEMLSNNLLLSLLCNNINNPTLPLNNSLNSNLNLLNMPYNSMNLFSLYGQNTDALNSLNNTQLQYLINSGNSTSDINLSNADSFTTTSTTQSNSLESNHSSTNDTILSKESLDKTTVSTNASDNNIMTYKLQDSHSSTSLDTEFLNNLFLNSNLSTSNLDLLNLNPSTSDAKSSLDLLSDNLIPDLKNPLTETLKSDIPLENLKENKKTDSLINQKEYNYNNYRNEITVIKEHYKK
ncbi:hypothetical protein PIROE2DRAFT_2438 [Piromyces sp. E2]|nr:hypothetical protein PIROE2DRAFT_2438 [Piromyces sp. E2]|eukprot:OUM69575.1 hypothetical protein PIROE2DRAFT_2438 [Piromyces sp. E2]